MLEHHNRQEAEANAAGAKPVAIEPHRSPPLSSLLSPAQDSPQPPVDPDDRIESYDYALDPGAIADHPCPERDQSRLLVAQRSDGLQEDRSFSDLVHLLHPGDLLVLNDARVIPSRLRAQRATGGIVEVLLHPTGVSDACLQGRWQALALLQPSARIRKGETLSLVPSGDALRVEDPPGAELRRVSSPVAWEHLLQHGELPLPPYIPRPDGPTATDLERYQTIYAERAGAVAAPTAGLHFTAALMDSLSRRGVGVARLTLFVGPGTFLPVRSERLSGHSMHEEAFEIPESTAAAIAATRARGGRVVAVGTTTTRALESAADESGDVRSGAARTRLLIRPPHRFRTIDALVTNFHLPRSTLLALVAAFAGRERVLSWYQHAQKSGYRFYSYGDAMLIL